MTLYSRFVHFPLRKVTKMSENAVTILKKVSKRKSLMGSIDVETHPTNQGGDNKHLDILGHRK